MDSPDVAALLRGTEVFGQLDGRGLEALQRELAWFSLPGGQTLYEAGETSDALYVLKTGSLGVFVAARRGTPMRLAGVVAAGRTVGEIGMITGRRRGASVRALRDSELLRLSRTGFDALVRTQPQAMLGAARIAVGRLLQLGADEEAGAPRTFAILPFARNPDVFADLRAFAESLRHALLPWGDCTVIDARLGSGRDTGWFSERESEVRFVLYLDDGDEHWSRLCRRQADALLLRVDARRKAEAWPDAAAASAERARHRPRHLLLCHPPCEFIYGAAHAWCAALGGDVHHHHLRHRGDVERLARLLSGHGTGLVLSGGGARGFAQIGVVQALREAGILVDTVIGTSIGAIIGAGVAYEWDDGKMREACRRALVDGRPLADWTLPLVALTRGGRTTMLLREAFGEIDIEDLPIRFACVSADLTRGTAAVHRSGLLWRWLRASSAIPGILPPLFHHRHVYVDGAVINNLPTDVLRGEGPGRIIAVDIGADDMLTAQVEEAASPPFPELWRERRSGRRPSAFATLVRTGMLNAEAGSVRRRQLADLLLAPDLGRIGLLDWHEFDRAVAAGYRYARERLSA